MLRRRVPPSSERRGHDCTSPPLDGIRVIDLSRVLAGPYCTALLSDAGADVVKIESEHGEDSRHLGPFRDGESIYFNVLNRGKRSVALNLKNDGGDREALLTLIETADVVVENFRPGVTKRLGIDYEAARLAIRGSCTRPSPVSDRTGPCPEPPPTTL